MICHSSRSYITMEPIVFIFFMNRVHRNPILRDLNSPLGS